MCSSIWKPEESLVFLPGGLFCGFQNLHPDIQCLVNVVDSLRFLNR